MKSNLIQIDDLRAVELVICSNVESVADGHYFGPFADEAVAAAISAAQRVISNALGCYVADEDPLFANWHGGKRCRDDLRVGWVHANLSARELDVDDNGEEVFGEWLWAGGQAAERTKKSERQITCTRNSSSAGSFRPAELLAHARPGGAALTKGSSAM